MIEGKPGVRKATHLALRDPAYDRFYSLLEESRAPLLVRLYPEPHPLAPLAAGSLDTTGGFPYSRRG
jgi:hypothetical protein